MCVCLGVFVCVSMCEVACVCVYLIVKFIVIGYVCYSIVILSLHSIFNNLDKKMALNVQFFLKPF